jgi:hypothetical protein
VGGGGVENGGSRVAAGGPEARRGDEDDSKRIGISGRGRARGRRSALCLSLGADPLCHLPLVLADHNLTSGPEATHPSEHKHTHTQRESICRAAPFRTLRSLSSAAIRGTREHSLKLAVTCSQVNLSTGTYGPFQPMVPTKVPLWFAVQLVQRNLGKVQPPDWLHEDAVNDLWDREDRSREMQLLQIVIATPPTPLRSITPSFPPCNSRRTEAFLLCPS